MTAQPIDLAQYGLVAIDVQPSGHHLPSFGGAPRPVLQLRLERAIGGAPRTVVLVLRDADHLDQIRAALDAALTEAADAARFAGAVAAAVDAGQPVGNDGLTDTERANYHQHWRDTYAHRPSGDELQALRARRQQTEALQPNPHRESTER